MRSLSAFLLALSGFLGACDFAAPVDIDLPPYEPRVVVGGFVEAGAPVEIRFARSMAAEATDTSATPYLGAGGEVVLFDGNGAVLDTLRAVSPQFGSLYPRYVSAVVAEGGARYELRATFPGLPPVRAVTTVPQPVTLTLRDLGPAPVGNEETNVGRRVELAWTDAAGSTAYAVTAIQPDQPAGYSQQVTFSSLDLALREDYDQLGRPRAVNPELGGSPEQSYFGDAFFLDDDFDGAARALELVAIVYDTPGPDVVRLGVSVLSDDFVRYMTALRVQQRSASDPFVEPTQAFTNVEGGLGVFAGFAPTTVDLRVD